MWTWECRGESDSPWRKLFFYWVPIILLVFPNGKCLLSGGHFLLSPRFGARRKPRPCTSRKTSPRANNRTLSQYPFAVPSCRKHFLFYIICRAMAKITALKISSGSYSKWCHCSLLPPAPPFLSFQNILKSLDFHPPPSLLFTLKPDND